MLHFKMKDYQEYVQHDFKHRWLRPSVLIKKLSEFKRSSNFHFTDFGYSEQNRPLSCIKYGNGPLKIMLWTQMHGNESTATMALIDLLNFLDSTNDNYGDYRRRLSQAVTLLIIPMLNPDGSEAFTRRNAFQIDMNRDAVSRESSEMKAFYKLFEDFKPHWAFNLHDQRTFFSAGTTSKTATISFLAASADEERTITPTREMSMKLICGLNRLVQNEIPGHVGKYSDEFYPTALGEFFHIREVPCVLIESGTFPGDLCRDTARKMNFLLLLRAFEIITEKSWDQYSIEEYQAIPQNGKSIRDLLIRNCKIHNNGKTIHIDLGFTVEEKPDLKTGKLNKSFKLSDLGDLTYLYGIEEKEGGVIENKEIPIPDKKAHFAIRSNSGERLVFDQGVLTVEKP